MLKFKRFDGDLKVGMTVKYHERNDVTGKITEVVGDKARIGTWNVRRRDDKFWGADSGYGYLLVGIEDNRPIKFIITYDTKSVDPYELFPTKEEMEIWIKEAKNNSNIIFESIQVFEVTNHKKIRISVNFVKA